MDRYRVTKGSKYSHVGMSTPRGVFNVPENDKVKFFNMYNKFVFKSKNRCDLIEHHKDIGYLLFDLDFKLDSEIDKHLYTSDFIINFLNILSSLITKYFDVDGSLFKAFVMEKEICKNKPQKKDGLHIVFPYIVSSPDIQYLLREELLVECEELFESLNTISSGEDIIDECVIQKNGWMMYGSYKENCSPYMLTGIYDCSEEDNIKRVDSSIYYVNTEELCSFLSIRNATIADITPVNDSVKILLENWSVQKKRNEIDKKKVNMNASNNINLYRNDLQTVKNLVEILSVKRAESYNTWIEVGWCLHNIDFTLIDEWINFSMKSNKHVETSDIECKSRWAIMKDTGLNIGTLHMWAKRDNPVEYTNIIQNNIEYHICKSVSFKPSKYENSEMVYHIVMALKQKYGHSFICSSYSKRSWYEYNGVRWIEGDDDVGLRRKIREELYEDYNNVGIKYISLCKTLSKLSNEHPNMKKYETISSMILGISKQFRDAKFRKKITEEACEQLYWDKEKSDEFQGSSFEEILDTKTNLIGLQNGVYDLNLHQFREGRCEDYITLNTNQEWKEYAWIDSIIDDIRDFLSQVIPNESVREYVLFTLSTFLDGEIAHEHFNIWVGSGGNGKSKLIEMFEHAMGKYCSKLPVSLLTQKRASSNAPTPEIVRLKGKRMVVLQEPEDREKLQVGLMKELSGGDKIIARGLNKEPIEFKPQFKMVLTCNKLPKVPSDDGGTWRRIRVVKFTSEFKEIPDPEKDNQFPADPHLSEKLIKWGQPFFWMLTQYYKKYKDIGFSEPEEVKLSTREYQKTNDMYSDFIDIHLEKVPNGVVYLDDIFTVFQVWFRSGFPDRKSPTRKDLSDYIEKKIGPYVCSKSKKRGWRGYKCHDVVVQNETKTESDFLDDDEDLVQ